MNQQPNQREQAAAALAEVERRHAEVRSSAGTGWRILLGWAVFVLVMLPLFDHVKPQTAGIIITIGAAVGAVLSAVYGLRSRVVTRGELRRFVLTYVFWTPWYAALIVVLSIFGDRLSLAWTLGGVLASLPLIAAALWERSR